MVSCRSMLHMSPQVPSFQWEIGTRGRVAQLPKGLWGQWIKWGTWATLFFHRVETRGQAAQLPHISWGQYMAGFSDQLHDVIWHIFLKRHCFKGEGGMDLLSSGEGALVWWRSPGSLVEIGPSVMVATPGVFVLRGVDMIWHIPGCPAPGLGGIHLLSLQHTFLPSGAGPHQVSWRLRGLCPRVDAVASPSATLAILRRP